MKTLLIASVSLVAINAPVFADCCNVKPTPTYEFSGATNLNTVTQGEGINSSFVSQNALFADGDIKDITSVNIAADVDVNSKNIVADIDVDLPQGPGHSGGPRSDLSE